MSTVIDELVVLLGAEVSPQAQAKLDKFHNKLESINRVAKGVIAGLSGMAMGLVYFAHRANETVAGMERFHRITGMTLRDIQSWRWAIEQAGGSADDFYGAFKSMTVGVNSFMPGRYNEGLFRLFGPEGLRNIRSAADAFGMINQAFQGMTAQEQLQWAADLGIDESMLLLLQKSPAEYRRLVAEGKKHADVTHAQAEEAKKFKQAWDAATRQINLLGLSIGTKLAPVFTKLIRMFERWYAQNKEWLNKRVENVILGITEGLVRLGRAAERAFEFLLPGLKKVGEFVDKKDAIAGLIEGLGKLAVGLVGLSVVATVVKTLGSLAALFGAAGLFSPGGAVIAGILALAGAAFLLYKNWDAVAGAVDRAIGSLYGFANQQGFSMLDSGDEFGRGAGFLGTITGAGATINNSGGNRNTTINNLTVNSPAGQSLMRSAWGLVGGAP